MHTSLFNSCTKVNRVLLLFLVPGMVNKRKKKMSISGKYSKSVLYSVQIYFLTALKASISITI